MLKTKCIHIERIFVVAFDRLSRVMRSRTSFWWALAPGILKISVPNWCAALVSNSNNFKFHTALASKASRWASKMPKLGKTKCNVWYLTSQRHFHTNCILQQQFFSLYKKEPDPELKSKRSAPAPQWCFYDNTFIFNWLLQLEQQQ